jgi:hypothetical protein
MTKAKYDKYFIHQTDSSPLHPRGGFPGIPLIWVDGRFMKGAFYFECIWQTGPIPENKAYKPHSHDWDEYVGFFGSNVEDPFNLNAEIQFWMNDEKHVLTKNCLVFVPAGFWHGPVVVNNITRPIFCLSTSPTTKYTQNVNRDPKWAHLEDPPEGKR